MIDKNIKECPNCGSEEYYIKQSYKGKNNFFMRFDGSEEKIQICMQLLNIKI